MGRNGVLTLRILFMFPGPTQQLEREVLAGRAPSERLYGLLPLRAAGFDASVFDAPVRGMSAKFVRWVRAYGVRLPAGRTLAEMSRSDIVVFKDEFSLPMTLAARIVGARVIYLDATFGVPARWWRRWSARLSILLADAVITYSDFERELWSQALAVPSTEIVVARFGLDIDFYRRRMASEGHSKRRYVLAVGRDLGRDYACLVSALAGTGVDLKLVTLPYLLRGVDWRRPWLEVLQRIEYDELFALYHDAAAVVVPLRAGVEYPSGVRAMLEAMLLERPVVVSDTPVLREYATENEVCFVPPEDPAAMRAAVLGLLQDLDSEAMRDRLIMARNRVLQDFNADQFGDTLCSVVACSGR